LEQIQEVLEIGTGKRLSIATIAKYIGRFNYSFKRLNVIAAAANTEALWQERNQFAVWFLTQRGNQRNIVFVDEVGFKMTTRVSRGRSKKGEKAQYVGPAINSRNVSVVAGMTNTGLLHYEVLTGPGNSERFMHFIDDMAGARDLLRLPNDSVIIMDNVPFHRNRQVVELMELRGWNYKFLPPYSPFLNPIECLFSQWKNYVKNPRRNF